MTQHFPPPSSPTSQSLPLVSATFAYWPQYPSQKKPKKNPYRGGCVTTGLISIDTVEDERGEGGGGVGEGDGAPPLPLPSSPTKPARPPPAPPPRAPAGPQTGVATGGGGGGASYLAAAR